MLLTFLQNPNIQTANALAPLFPKEVENWQDVPFILRTSDPAELAEAARLSEAFLDQKRQGRKRWDFPIYLGQPTCSIRDMLKETPIEGWVCPVDGGDLDDSIPGKFIDVNGVDWAPVLPQVGNGCGAAVAWALRGTGRSLRHVIPQDLLGNTYRLVQDLASSQVLPWVGRLLEGYNRLPAHERDKVVADLLRPQLQSACAAAPEPNPPRIEEDLSDLSNPAIRRMIQDTLKTITEFDAFCLDYYPSIYRRFSAGMERSQRENLLITLVDDKRSLMQLLSDLRRSL